MKEVNNFLVFFVGFPFIILRAVFANGMFGFRSREDWLMAGVIYISSIPVIPSFFWSSLIVGSLAWFWCVFIWFAYRIDCDRGGYTNFSADLKALVESRVGVMPVEGFWASLPALPSYIRYTYIFWHASLSGIFLFIGIMILLGSAGRS